MTNNMNIGNFMTWWINQVVNIITWTYTTLDHIQFGGTTLLRVIIMLTLMGIFLPIFLKLGKGVQNVSERIPRK